MPAPLQTPATRTCLPSTKIDACATFGLVSVVIMAGANCAKCSGVVPREDAISGNAAIGFSAGSGTPIIPVEEGKTSCPSQWNVFAAAAQTCSHASIPICPVAQFALPAFTATTRMRPLLRARCFRPTMIGAATTRLLVNMAAAFAGASATATAKSALPLGLIPAFTAAKQKPSGSSSEGTRDESFIVGIYSNQDTNSERITIGNRTPGGIFAHAAGQRSAWRCGCAA